MVDKLEGTDATARETLERAAASELRAFAFLLIQRVRRFRIEDDLAPSESAALLRLDVEQPLTTADLARREGIRSQSMAAAVGRLEARGLVRREPDAADGRRILLVLTDEGVATAQQRLQQREDQVLRALADEFTLPELRRLVEASSLLMRVAERFR